MPDSTIFDHLKQLYEAGDKSRLLAAIRLCGERGIPMPQWVVDEFRKGTDRWFKGEARELGEALGIQHPKGRHLSAWLKKRQNIYEVYNRVVKASIAGTPIDEDLFEKIGRELHIGKTLASEYYYEAKTYLEPDFREK